LFYQAKGSQHKGGDFKMVEEALLMQIASALQEIKELLKKILKELKKK